MSRHRGFLLLIATVLLTMVIFNFLNFSNRKKPLGLMVMRDGEWWQGVEQQEPGEEGRNRSGAAVVTMRRGAADDNTSSISNKEVEGRHQASDTQQEETTRQHQLVLSMHIRKGGGSSLWRIFKTQAKKIQTLGTTNVSVKSIHPVEGHNNMPSSHAMPIGCNFPDIERLKDTGEIYHTDLLHGFFPWEAMNLIPADINVITAMLFRDPTERVISAYFYERRMSETGELVFQSYEDNLTLMMYAKREVRRQGYYMRMLCRCDCNPPKYTPTDVELVKQRLDTVGILGITSRMKDFVLELNRHIPWLQEDASKHDVCTQNCGPSKATYRSQHPEVAKFLDEGLEYDWELFRYVEDLVAKRNRLE